MRKLLVLITVICMLLPMMVLPVFAESGTDDLTMLDDAGDEGATDDGAEDTTDETPTDPDSGEDTPDTEGDGTDPAITEPEELGDFVVGATTRLNGMFFTNMWGNNTCDIDVRSMIYGYSPVVWTTQLVFQPDRNVVYDIKTGVSDGGDKLYMISLQDDLKYCDGSPITAYDYAFSLMLHAAPQVTEIDGLTTNVGYIHGYDEYNAGESEIFAGVRVFDELTFGIVIKSEYLPFFFEMSMIDVVPYPMSVIAPGCEIADDGEGAYIRNIDQSYPEPIFTADLLRQTILDPDTGYLSHPTVTCGPYMLTGFDWETREARFEINPYYKGDYQNQKPTIDNIVFKSVIPETMVEELQAGEVQLLNKVVAAETINKALMMGITEGIRGQGYFRMGLGLLNFACEMGPMQYENVRKAVAYSFDTDGFVESYNANYGQAVYGYYGLGQWMVRLFNGFTDITIETEEEQLAWDTLRADWEKTLNHYDLYEGEDVDSRKTVGIDKAKNLLIEDGWTLNENGESFEEGVDTVRYKDVNGELMGLIINWGKMKDSIAANLIEEMLIPNLEAIGMQVVIEEVEFVNLLEHYYRQVDRKYDMIYLATNFIDVFDPYFVYNTADEFQGKINASGYRDEHLEALAKDLRETEPGNLYEYCEKWLTFQQYFNEVLPIMPIYSNMYFDFHTPMLTNYDPNLAGWPIAILYANYGAVDPADETMEAEGFTADGESVLGDLEAAEPVDDVNELDDSTDGEDIMVLD